MEDAMMCIDAVVDVDAAGGVEKLTTSKKSWKSLVKRERKCLKTWMKCKTDYPSVELTFSTNA